MNETTKHANRLVELACNLANEIEALGMDKYEELFGKSLRIGIRTCSIDLRQGAKAIIQLQEDVVRQKERAEFSKVGEEEMKDFIVDIFGDENAYMLSDEHKEKLKAFVNDLFKEDEDD